MSVRNEAYVDLETFRKASKRMTDPEHTRGDEVAIDELVRRTELHIRQLRADLAAFEASRSGGAYGRPRDVRTPPTQAEDANLD